MTGPESDVFRKTRHDFGKVRAGEQLVCSFPLINPWEQPLAIRSVKASCGCLIPELDHAPVTQGELRDLSVVLSTAGLEPPLALEKKVWVELASGDRPFAAVLSILAELRCDIAVDPPEIAFGPHATGSQGRAQLTIRRDLLPPAEFASLRVVAPTSHYTLEQITRNSNIARMTIGLVESSLGTDPQPLEIRYERDGVEMSVLVPVSCAPRAGKVHLIPSSYIAHLDQDKSVTARWGRSAQQFRLSAEGRGARVTVTGVHRLNQHTPRSIGWDVLPEEPDRFVVWQEKVPHEQAVHSEVLRVTYQLHDQQGVSRGAIRFTAYALSDAFAEVGTHCARQQLENER